MSNLNAVGTINRSFVIHGVVDVDPVTYFVAIVTTGATLNGGMSNLISEKILVTNPPLSRKWVDIKLMESFIMLKFVVIGEEKG